MSLDKRELTDEGKRMFENLESYDDKLFEERPKTRRKRVAVKEEEVAIPLEVSEEMKQLMILKANLEKLVENSIKVIQDCDKLMSAYKTKEEYLASEHKTAKYCHQNFADRLKKVLAGEDPFKK